jgi:hypothetical protein
MKRRIPGTCQIKRGNFCGFALVLCAGWICVEWPSARAQDSPSPTPARTFESLKGKSDEELVRLLVGGKSRWKLEREEQRANEVKTHFPDHFWEMPPKEAALALVQDNCNLKLKPQLKISVREDKGGPPAKGRIELQSEAGYGGLESETLLILSSDGMRLALEFSSIELHGPVKRSAIERALRRTRRSAVPMEEVRRLYEVIWWLGRIQFAHPEQTAGTSEVTMSRLIATHSVRGKLSVEGGPHKREFTLCPASLSECYYETFDNDLYAGFVDFILRETLKRHGVNLDETTTAELGEEVFSSAEEKFVYRSKPPPPDDPGTPKWIDRMLRNLDRYRSSVISRLASLDEPLRYGDPRIDEALFRVARQGLTPRPPNRRTGQSDFEDAAQAAHALATRKRADAFPIIMQLLKVEGKEVNYSKDRLLDAASLLSPARPEFEQRLTEYLGTQLNDFAKSPHPSSALFDSVWRANLRALTPLLEKMATTSPEEIEDEQGTAKIDPPRPVVGRFHDARRILIAWREPDALTKLKLDAIIETTSFHLAGPADFFRQEFEALPADQQQTFIAFVGWLEKNRPEDSSWYLESVKEVYGPARKLPEDR